MDLSWSRQTNLEPQRHHVPQHLQKMIFAANAAKISTHYETILLEFPQGMPPRIRAFIDREITASPLTAGICTERFSQVLVTS
jgi:hypothetical protein